MTLDDNLNKEFEPYTKGDGHLMLKVYQDLHGLQAGLVAFLDQMQWNLNQRAQVNGQDVIAREGAIQETVEVTVTEQNTLKPLFTKFGLGYTSGYLKYFSLLKPGTKLKITIEEQL